MVTLRNEAMYQPPDPEEAAVQILRRSNPPGSGFTYDEWEDIKAEAALIYLQGYRQWESTPSAVPPTIKSAFEFAQGNMRRKRKHFLDLPEDNHPTDGSTPHDEVIKKEQGEAVIRAFGKCPRQHQHVLQTAPEETARVFECLEADPTFNRKGYHLWPKDIQRGLNHQVIQWGHEDDSNTQKAVQAQTAREEFLKHLRKDPTVYEF